ncbi:hypothetical protein [Aureliella helgolandensis]|uniref:Peptidase family M50 n=1 Tax=Aureliella helgolandensis TaxID=2527968 RepID=A0A518GA64_9BACT|nr:hypothetical protein [Aureliella helgolandensis]QDV25459.1 hypothetical protein Q31a_37850 [Aureliella helgolandensis]
MRWRIAKFLILLILAWCTMTTLHEFGHIVSGWACGGTLQSVSLVPWSLPYSIFEPDPWPLFTLWGGPIVGSLLPVMLALIVRQPWSAFIAYFCLLSNGAYLATAWMTGDRYLDTTKLLDHGAPPLAIAAFCGLTISVGYLGFRRQCIYWLSPELDNDSTGSSCTASTTT